MIPLKFNEQNICRFLGLISHFKMFEKILDNTPISGNNVEFAVIPEKTP